MKNKLLMVALIAGMFCVSLVNSTMALESDLNSLVRGIVVEITPSYIVVQEIKDEGNEISQFEIKINEETNFENAASNEEITQGDEVEIQYKETKSGKIAVLINEASLDEEDMEELKKL